MKARARCACGVWIIGDRAKWATPVCVGCLPPPAPLPIAKSGLVLLVFALLAGCAPTWTGAAMATEVSTVGLLACDGGTTDQYLRDSAWVETNPALGQHPSDVRLWGYLGTIAAAVVVANRKLPPKWAFLLNLTVSAAEVYSVANNMHVGASACGVGDGGPWRPLPDTTTKAH